MFGFHPANPPITDWRGRHIWVIGASAGIGKAVAHSLQTQGAQLTLSARNLSAVETDEKLSDCRCIAMDISDTQSIASAIEQVTKPIDVVMIFAGSYQAGALINHSQQAIQQTIATNLTGVIDCCHQLLPTLKAQQHGHLVLVGSSAAYLPMPNASVYGASKAGLGYFAQSLYTECRADNIAVSLVSPGFVKTRLTDQNNFSMPSLLSTEEASHALLSGLGKGSFDIAFPWGFTLTLKLINALPWHLRQVLLNRLAQQDKP
ncbi:MAG: SDR family NAD(P)-dependent oxidoreductase [Gammaproteobacteria bacterium]|nr:SDR family NAD(P)-dependent oxidoreductase [Gammaproteobacteria bacterium]